MNPSYFDFLTIEQKISFFIEIVVDKKGTRKIVMKQEIQYEKWFLKGNQWVGPKGQTVEILGASNGYQVDLQKYVDTPNARISHQKRTKNV